MTQKHTPGPWNSIGADIHGWEGDTAVRLARCDRAQLSQQKAEANACLIAAVPDGLQLAYAVAEHFKDTDAPLGKQARDFIARATGKETT